MTPNVKKFVLKNTTWHFHLSVRVGGTRDEAEAVFNRLLGKEVQASEGTAGTFFFKEGEKSCLVWFAETPTPGICAHEAFHCACHVLKCSGLGPLTDETDEAYAYLLQWVVEEISRKLAPQPEKPT